MNGIDVSTAAAWASIIAAFATLALASFTWRLASETKDLAKQTARESAYESMREQRAARPVIVATSESNAITSSTGAIIKTNPAIFLRNKGAIAYKVAVSTMSSTKGFQVIAIADDRIFVEALPELGSSRKIRIRYLDGFGNKYITEYEAFSKSTQFPIFRLPWIGSAIGEPKPSRWSEEVTWPVANIERYPKSVDEALDAVPPDQG